MNLQEVKNVYQYLQEGCSSKMCNFIVIEKPTILEKKETVLHYNTGDSSVYTLTIVDKENKNLVILNTPIDSCKFIQEEGYLVVKYFHTINPEVYIFINPELINISL